MRLMKIFGLWIILWFTIFSGSSLQAAGYVWEGNAGESLLPVAGQEGNQWSEAGYGTTQFFIGYRNTSQKILSATLGENEVFDTQKTSTDWPVTIENGSFCIGRWNGLQSTLSLSSNAVMKTGTNFWVMYGEGATEATFDSTVGTLNMTDTSSLYVENAFNICGQNYNHGKVFLSGNASISANNIMETIGTNTDVEITLAGTSSITSRGSVFHIRGTKNRTTLTDSAFFKANGSISVNGQDTAVSLSDSARFEANSMSINGQNTVVSWKDNAQTQIATYLNVGNEENANVTLQLSGNTKVVANGTVDYSLARGKNSTVKMEISDSATLVLGVGGVPGNTKPRTADGLNSSFTLNQTGGRVVFYGRTCLGEGEAAQENGTYNSTTSVSISGGTQTVNAVILGSRASAELELSDDGVFNCWGRFIINYYNFTEKAGIFSQTGGTANIWANNSHWHQTNGVGITFGMTSNSTMHPGQYNISGGTLNTYALRNYNAYTTNNTTADASLFNISGDAVVNIIEQADRAGSGVLAVPTRMTGGTLNVKEIQTSRMAHGTFLQQGGILSPDGGTAITPATFANTNSGAETYAIDDLMGFRPGEGSSSTQITGNYTISTLDSAVSRAEIRLEQDDTGKYDSILVTGEMNIEEDVLLSIYLAENSPEGFFPLITAEGGITGEFAELQVFDYLGNLLNKDVNSLIYQGNAIVFANVPEPATWGMLLLGMLFLTRRKWLSGKNKS